MIYTRIMPVEFNHCDPAGIVFYPRYFEMANSVVENFFAEAVGHSFGKMMAERHGVPTARLEANFKVPSRLGDRLEWSLQVLRVGGSSVNFLLTAGVDGTVRLTADLTLVWMAEGRPTSWPDAIRAKLDVCQRSVA